MIQVCHLNNLTYYILLNIESLQELKSFVFILQKKVNELALRGCAKVRQNKNSLY